MVSLRVSIGIVTFDGIVLDTLRLSRPRSSWGITHSLTHSLAHLKVFTIEPGLYFPPQDMALPKDLRGIGFRIEDDVANVDGKFEVLTSMMPKVGEWVDGVIQACIHSLDQKCSYITGYLYHICMLP